MIFLAIVVLVSLVLEHFVRIGEALGRRALSIIEHRYSAEHLDREARLELDREIFERANPVKPDASGKPRLVIVPPEIEDQLSDAPEWEREDTRARAMELYVELERQQPDQKPGDRWGRVHKLLEMETEAVESTV